MFKLIRDLANKFNLKEEKRLELMKQDIIYNLTREWSISEIRDYNINIIISYTYEFEKTNVGNFTEQDIKLCLLNNHLSLFTNDEYEYYYNLIVKPKTLTLK